VLAGWCTVAGCEVEPPRRIEDITVENSAIAPAAPGTDSLRLSVTLRNHAAIPVKTPFVELSLTDTQGQLIARRALTPDDFGASAAAIAPAAEVAWQTLLSTGTSRVVGYTVEAFYP
jgi:hypothetical protein